jgi:hypothetical protein
MRIYSTKEINLNHTQFMVLRRANKVRLGINNDTALKVSQSDLMPKKSTVGAAATFWTWFSIALFFGSVYLSFTWAWWAFIPGIALTVMFFSANKAGNSENLLDLADQDATFYENVRMLGGWQYQMTEEDAHPYTWAGIAEASA